LEIDKDKSFKLFAEKVYGNRESADYYELDSAKMGYFKGTLTQKQFSYLNNRIKILNKERYNTNDGKIVFDLPPISVLIQRGADKTCIQTNDPTQRFKKDFVYFLNDICSRDDLMRVEEFVVHFKNGCNEPEFAKGYFESTSR